MTDGRRPLEDPSTPNRDGYALRDDRLERLLRSPADLAFQRHPHDAVFGRSVLITGAAGSIGAGLARQAAAGDAERLTLLDTDESGLFDLAVELEAGRGPGRPRIEVVVGSVTSRRTLGRVFAQQRPTVVLHAAAYKHVPLMEAHPEEAVETNVLGTLNVCLAAEQAGSERVVVLSTDKAVAPSSVMGATKRLGERIVQAFSSGGTTVFCAVRCGNVLWSRGSVAPTFERQIRRGGPVTITHRDMERCFLTLPEAVDLIVEAAYQAAGGEVFLLEMGDPVKIVDLARAMIRLYGPRPAGRIEIREIGPRPGEKLREALTGPDEQLLGTAHPRVARIVSSGSPADDRLALVELIERLSRLAETGPREALVCELFAAGQFSALGS